jgi:hypothetical protein
LNRRLDDATLVVEMRNPFDVLAEGVVFQKSRGDWTALELFRAAVRRWPERIRGLLLAA